MLEFLFNEQNKRYRNWGSTFEKAVCLCVWASILLVPIRTGYNVGMKENKPNFVKLKRKQSLGQWSLSRNNTSFLNISKALCERAKQLQLQCLIAFFVLYFIASLSKLSLKSQFFYGPGSGGLIACSMQKSRPYSEAVCKLLVSVWLFHLLIVGPVNAFLDRGLSWSFSGTRLNSFHIRPTLSNM